MKNYFKIKIDKIFIVIFIFAVLIRLYSFFFTYVISRDSSLYLYQAMVLFHKNLDLLAWCGFSSRIKEINFFSLSLIPFYFIFKDWEVAGKFLSFFSSSLSIFVLYLILRKIYEGFPLYLTLIVYILNPTIVEQSGEILRESYFTFLVLCGILFFIYALKASFIKKIFLFFIAYVFWILSAWVRIEGILFIPLSFIYLAIKLIFSVNKKEALISLLAFLSLLLFGFILVFFYIFQFKSFFLTELKEKLNLINPFTQPFKFTLKNFKYLDVPMPSPYFWDIVAQNLWLIALGTTLFYKFIPALHFSNLLFLFFAFQNFKTYLKSNSFFQYLSFLSLCYLIILWYFTFTKWYMEKRYMLPLLYCISPFIGLGIFNLQQFLKQKLSFSNIKTVTLLVLYIIIFSSFKTLQPHRKDLVILKTLSLKIASVISKEELKECLSTSCPNFIFTREGRIIFYLSNHLKIPLCPKSENRIFYEKMKNLPSQEILNYITSQGFKIVILEEKVFGDKISILKQKLEEKNIKTFILSAKENE